MRALALVAALLLASCEPESSPFGPGCDVEAVVVLTREALDSIIAATPASHLWVYEDSAFVLVSRGCP